MYGHVGVRPTDAKRRQRWIGGCLGALNRHTELLDAENHRDDQASEHGLTNQPVSPARRRLPAALRDRRQGDAGDHQHNQPAEPREQPDRAGRQRLGHDRKGNARDTAAFRPADPRFQIPIAKAIHVELAEIDALRAGIAVHLGHWRSIERLATWSDAEAHYHTGHILLWCDVKVEWRRSRRWDLDRDRDLVWPKLLGVGLHWAGMPAMGQR